MYSQERVLFVRRFGMKTFCLCTLIALVGLSERVQAITLIADYRFDSAVNLGLDTSGLGNNATNAGVTQGLDRFGNPSAGVFNGASALTKSSGLTGFTGLPGFTYSAWINRSSQDGGFSGIVSQDPAGGACCTNRFLLDSSDTFYVDAGAHVDFDYGAPVIPNDTWVHVVMTADDSFPRNLVSLYVNGALVGTNAFGHNLVDSSLFDTFIGTGENGAAHFFQGLMDDVQIYEGALSALEVRELFNGPQITIPEPAGLGMLGIVLLSGLRRRTA
jgi:hypothetical protein